MREMYNAPVPPVKVRVNSTDAPPAAPLMPPPPPMEVKNPVVEDTEAGVGLRDSVSSQDDIKLLHNSLRKQSSKTSAIRCYCPNQVYRGSIEHGG